MSILNSTSNIQVTLNLKVGSRLKVINLKCICAGVVGEVGRVCADLCVSSVSGNKRYVVGKIGRCSLCNVDQICPICDTSQVASKVTRDLSSNTQSATDRGVGSNIQGVGCCETTSNDVTTCGLQLDLSGARSIIKLQCLTSTLQHNVVIKSGCAILSDRIVECAGTIDIQSRVKVNAIDDVKGCIECCCTSDIKCACNISITSVTLDNKLISIDQDTTRDVGRCCGVECCSIDGCKGGSTSNSKGATNSSITSCAVKHNSASVVWTQCQFLTDEDIISNGHATCRQSNGSVRRKTGGVGAIGEEDSTTEFLTTLLDHVTIHSEVTVDLDVSSKRNVTSKGSATCNLQGTTSSEECR